MGECCDPCCCNPCCCCCKENIAPPNNGATVTPTITPVPRVPTTQPNPNTNHDPLPITWPVVLETPQPIIVEDWFDPPEPDPAENEDTPVHGSRPPPEVIPPVGTQLTPEYSVVPPIGAPTTRLATTLSQAVPTVHDQGPEPDWIGTTWDGGWGEYDYSTPIDITGKTPAQMCTLLFKAGYTMKGLRQRYNELMPFADPTNPTVAEIDAWNIEVIRHLRKLVGNTIPVDPDPRLYLECQWSDERAYTRAWDAMYPGTNNSAYGPCVAFTNEHCGSTFIPNATDQLPYLAQYSGLAPFAHIGGAEDIGPVNTNVPWALKIVQRISNWVCTEGTTGHAGPFFSRTKVGMSFYTPVTGGVPDATTYARFKWSG